MRTEQPNRCAVFNGTSSYIDFGDICNFSSNFTISAWVKISTLKNTMIASRRYGVTTQYGLFVSNFGVPKVFSESSSGDGSGSLSTGIWYLLTGVWGVGGNVELYVDGQLDSTHSLPAITPSSSSLELGRRATSGAQVLDGKLADVQIFPAALTAGQVAELFTLKTQALRGVSRSLWAKLDSLDAIKHYDSSGNAAVGIPTDIAYSEDSSLPLSYQNDNGYTLSGGVYVPRNEADKEKDVLGNPLGFVGPLPRISGGIAMPAPSSLASSQFVLPERFGAIGDGVTDDTVAVGLAIDEALSSGKNLFLDGQYLLTSAITKTLESDLTIESATGAALVTDVQALGFSGKSVVRTVATDIVNNATTITLVSAAGIEPGDWINLRSTVVAEYTWNTVAREIHVVKSVAGNVVTIEGRIRFAYTIAEVSLCATFKATKLTLKDLRIRSSGSAIHDLIFDGLQVTCNGLDSVTTGTGKWLVSVRNSVGSRFTNTRSKLHQYGISFDYCANCVSDGFQGERVNQPQLVNGWSRSCIFRNAINVNGGEVLDGHPSIDTKYENCHAVDCSGLGSPRGIGVTVVNCTLRTTSSIQVHTFGPPTPNGVSPNSGLNVTRYPWLSDHTVTLDGVQLHGPAGSASCGITIAGNATRVMMSNCIAPGIIMECPVSTAELKINNSTCGYFGDRHAGPTETTGLTIDKNLHGLRTTAMHQSFGSLTIHTGLACLNFDNTTDTLYNNHAGTFLFANCSLTGFTDWRAVGAPAALLISNSVIGIANNAGAIPLTNVVNCIGTFGAPL